ncbi:hypothetical protein B0H13DRAFT_1906761 [Mycena leptocephala]|nr:hypothetical protein B0H13DRAFT_1906761 [Mycena leptocephala]
MTQNGTASICAKRQPANIESAPSRLFPADGTLAPDLEPDALVHAYTSLMRNAATNEWTDPDRNWYLRGKITGVQYCRSPYFSHGFLILPVFDEAGTKQGSIFLERLAEGGPGRRLLDPLKPAGVPAYDRCLVAPDVTAAMGKYYEVHWFKLEKSLSPQEVICAAMTVSKTWEKYWLHKQNCFFFAAAVIEALCRRAAHIRPTVPTLEPLRCDIAPPPAAPDIAFWIFRQRFNGQIQDLRRRPDLLAPAPFGHQEGQTRPTPAPAPAVFIPSHEDNAPDAGDVELAVSEELRREWREEIDTAWGRDTRRWSLYV